MSEEREPRHLASSAYIDDEARAELLCYIVVGQLVARTRTGRWLAVNHVAELIDIWRLNNGAFGEWVEEFDFAFTDTPAIAQMFLPLPDFSSPENLARLFADGMRLDYRSPAVMAIYVACEAAVREI